MTDPVKALADAARRARVVLHNMTLERDGKLRMFSRWQISDEPLRNDAMHVVPAIDKALAAYDAAQAQPRPVPSSRNDLLREFSERFTLDGDYLRCRECNRPQIASRESEEFVHAASCKLRMSGGRPWVEIQTILMLPAQLDAAQAQPVHRPVGITGERDPDHPCEEFAPGSPDPGRCLGDGHYLCNECRHYYAPEDTTEDTTNG